MQTTGLRLALLSTPRSGNTWARHLLTSLYGVPGRAVHYPEDLDWENLPNGLALQIHWRRSPGFERRLRENGFRVLVLSRHPLDVLISILQFCWRSSTSEWLAGEGGDERPLYGATPRNTAFVEYATGPRAAALFAVTREWRPAPDCIAVRYEDLVHAPAATLGRLVEVLGVPPRCDVDEALRGASIPALRERTQCAHHFWQGKPGLWKRLLTAAEARPIAAAHAALFAELGYECDPDSDLTPSQADANWLDLIGDGLAADLRALGPARRELAAAQAQAAAAQQALAQIQLQTHEELTAVRRAYDDLRSQFAAASEYHRDLEDRLAEAHQHVGEARVRLEHSQQACAGLREELGRTRRAWRRWPIWDRRAWQRPGC